jgi:hypothetical protein
MSATKTATTRPSRLAAVPLPLQPAVRAYLIGYILDALPTILKQLLRYALLNLKSLRRTRKRISQEREDLKSASSDVQLDTQLEAASTTSIYSDAFLPALRQLPGLLQNIARALANALGPRGIAMSCAMAMTGTVLLENALNSILIQSGKPWTHRQRRAMISTFASAATCSALSLQYLQYSAYGMNNSSNTARQFTKGFYNPFRRKVSNLNPTPLAPGGHFLARLTSLSIPATPKEAGSRSPSEKPLQLSPTDERDVSALQSREESEEAPSKGLGTASPTIDLTLFALVRAMDTLVRAIPALMQGRGKGRALGPQGGMKTDSARNELARLSVSNNRKLYSKIFSFAGRTIRSQAEGLTFVFACAIIMYNWFYSPERLPPSYVKWITNLASMDERLLLALRSLRNQNPHIWIYGNKKSTPASIDLLGALSESLGHPYSWGDPSLLPKNIADAQKQKRDAMSSNSSYLLQDAAGLRGKGKLGGLPCEIVHCGVGGSNCYKNALYRFLRAYKVCLGIYIPVHLLPRLIFGWKQIKKQPLDALVKVIKGSMRSAAFLSTFISSIWYVTYFLLYKRALTVLHLSHTGSWCV